MMSLSERYRFVRFVAHSNPDKFSMFWSGADRDVRICRSGPLKGPVGLAIADRTAASKFASGNMMFVWAAAVPDNPATTITDMRTVIRPLTPPRTVRHLMRRIEVQSGQKPTSFT